MTDATNCSSAMTDAPSITTALAAVMGDVQAVGKDQENTQQGYSFRGVDAVVNAAGPALRKHGVVPVPIVETVTYREVEVGQKRTIQRECTMTVRFCFYGPAGDHIDAVCAAEALDSGDKATAKAHSVAFRTCLLEVLAIPTHDIDPDAASPERAKRPKDAASEPTPRKDPELATQAQLAKIHVEAEKRELGDDFLHELVRRGAKIRELADVPDWPASGSMREITKRQASIFIDLIVKATDERIDELATKLMAEPEQANA